MKRQKSPSPWSPPMRADGQPDYEHFSNRDWREYEQLHQAMLRDLKAAGLPVIVVEVEHEDLRHEMN